MKRMLIPKSKLSIDEILRIFFIKENYPLHVYLDNKRLKISFDHIINSFFYSPSIILWAYGEKFFNTIPINVSDPPELSLDIDTFSKAIYNSYDVSKTPPNTETIVLDNINIYSSDGTYWYPSLILMEDNKELKFKKIREVGMKWTTLYKFLKTFYPNRENFSVYINSAIPYFNFYLYLRSLYAQFNKIASIELEKILLTPNIKKEEKDRILDELTRRKVLSAKL